MNINDAQAPQTPGPPQHTSDTCNMSPGQHPKSPELCHMDERRTYESMKRDIKKAIESIRAKSPEAACPRRPLPIATNTRALRSSTSASPQPRRSAPLWPVPLTPNPQPSDKPSEANMYRVLSSFRSLQRLLYRLLNKFHCFFLLPVPKTLKCFPYALLYALKKNAICETIFPVSFISSSSVGASLGTA